MWAERSEERTLVLGTCLTQLEKPYAKRRKKKDGSKEIQRRSNAFMRDYDDIRAEIDEIGIEMD